MNLEVSTCVGAWVCMVTPISIERASALIESEGVCPWRAGGCERPGRCCGELVVHRAAGAVLVVRRLHTEVSALELSPAAKAVLPMLRPCCDLALSPLDNRSALCHGHALSLGRPAHGSIAAMLQGSMAARALHQPPCLTVIHLGGCSSLPACLSFLCANRFLPYSNWSTALDESGWPTSPQVFYSALDDFLNSIAGAIYKDNLSLQRSNAPGNPIVGIQSARMQGFYVPLNDTEDFVNAMLESRQKVAEVPQVSTMKLLGRRITVHGLGLEA